MLFKLIKHTSQFLEALKVQLESGPNTPIFQGKLACFGAHDSVHDFQIILSTWKYLSVRDEGEAQLTAYTPP